MIADSKILSLENISLEMRALLPEYSGIYYVVDQYNIIVYIGQATNLRSRWAGRSHHRIEQLKATRQRSFQLYYEQVEESKLDEVEKSLIHKFNPELNDSRVVKGEINFTEGLLKETLRKLNGYILVLGINLQEKIIYLAFDHRQFRKDFNIDINTETTFLNWLFKSRKKYPEKWRHNDFQYCSFMFAELAVNGFQVRIENLNLLKFQKYDKLQDFDCLSTEFVQENIPRTSQECLNDLKSQNPETYFLQNLDTYKVGTLKYFESNIAIPTVDEYKEQLKRLRREFESGSRGCGSRSSKKEKAINVIEKLLAEQSQTTKARIQVVQTGGFSSEKISLYVKCFNLNHSSQLTINSAGCGKINGELVRKNTSQFEEIYLLSSCDKKIWLLLERCISDFVKIGLYPTEKEFPELACYTEKLYVSARRWVKPARFNIKFEGTHTGFGIPFGTSWNDSSMRFEAVKGEIKRRLSQADLPPYKLSFSPESIQMKGRKR